MCSLQLGFASTSIHDTNTLHPIRHQWWHLQHPSWLSHSKATRQPWARKPGYEVKPFTQAHTTDDYHLLSHVIILLMSSSCEHTQEYKLSLSASSSYIVYNTVILHTSCYTKSEILPTGPGLVSMSPLRINNSGIISTIILLRLDGTLQET